ncbi:MAG: glycosyltransferase [Bacteroidales bacterium]|nr:glycosyltransferase [Bacteroidales bacterium]
MRILVVLPRFPYPLDKGDKLRAYHQIVELAKRHEVHLFALSHKRVPHDDYDHLHTLCTAVDYVHLHWWESAWGVLKAFLGGKPLQAGYWTLRRARQEYLRWEQQVQPDVVYCQMVRTIPTVEGSSCRKVLDFQDALSLNTHRRMEYSHGPLRWILHYESRALQRYEQQALALFDATTVIAPADRDAISPSVHLVPNGVDTDYFSPRAAGVSPKYSIVFTGNMSYAPNVDAACWLVNEIMPTVWKRCPYGINVLIAGADPKPAVRALAGPRVTVSGRLPDIRSAYASARMFVAPMRIGSGMQNKLLEAMAMGLPCVTTSIAATPLGATPWEHLLVGDTAEEIADLIVKLTIDEMHHAIADGGHRFVLEHFSWPAAVEPLEEILNTLKL